ncbi:phosphocarrier protein HPr [Neobacillus drentensis]|uniref:phosphocarrier protein HPr n=1 Tax=Neobacillus drentensis TaxID=220684 RepID=UPI0030034025
MQEKNFVIIEKAGLYAIPVTILVKEASIFDADVHLIYNDKQVNLKSIMGVMSLGIPKGASIKVLSDGPDSEKALAALEHTMKREGLVD